MSAYKDTERGSWYVSFHYNDWTGKNRRKMKRGFKTKKEATDFEHHFKMEQASDLDMTFGDFWEVYKENVKPKIRYNTWCTKEHIVRTKILPYFEDKKMRDIKARDIIQWQNQMRTASYDEEEKEYSGTYLKTVQAQLAVVVGPPAMMRFSVKALLERGLKEENIWISQERKMCCGLGKCGHCKIGNKYVCLDGPVFNYTDGKKLLD